MRSFCASTALPVKSSARAQKAAVMRRKQNVKLKKIMTKTMFVRRAQRKKMKDKTPIKSSQNAIEILARLFLSIIDIYLPKLALKP